MSRVATDTITVQDRAGNVQPGTTVWIYLRGTTTAAALYDAPTAGSAVTQPVSTDNDGHPVTPTGDPIWVDSAPYDVVAPAYSRTLHWEAYSADIPGAVADAVAEAVTTSEAYTDAPPTVNTISGNYTLALGDKGNVILETVDAGAQTITIPPNSSVAFPVGSVIEVVRIGAGLPTFAAGAGVSIQSPLGGLTIPTQYGSATLRKRATNTWHLISGP